MRILYIDIFIKNDEDIKTDWNSLNQRPPHLEEIVLNQEKHLPGFEYFFGYPISDDNDQFADFLLVSVGKFRGHFTFLK